MFGEIVIFFMFLVNCYVCCCFVFDFGFCVFLCVIV